MPADPCDALKRLNALSTAARDELIAFLTFSATIPGRPGADEAAYFESLLQLRATSGRTVSD